MSPPSTALCRRLGAMPGVGSPASSLHQPTRPVSPVSAADLLHYHGWTGGFIFSECRTLCSATSGPAWELGPRRTVSSGRIIYAEHINQLSCFYAQLFQFFTLVRFDQALYFFGKKLFVKKFLVITLFVTHKFKYPVYLGASFRKPFLLHMIILVRLRSLFVYYATICTILT